MKHQKTLVVLSLFVLGIILLAEVNITPISHFAQAQNYGQEPIIISEFLMVCKSRTGIDIFEIQEDSELLFKSHSDVISPSTFRVHENYVYVMSRLNNLDVSVKRLTQIDISDINEPVITEEIDFNQSETSPFIEIFNTNQLFIYKTDSDDIHSTHIYSLPDLQLIHTSDADYNNLSALNDTIGYDYNYYGNSIHNLDIYDVSNINNITFIEEIEMYQYHGSGNMPHQFIHFGNSMLAAAGNTCITFWDISNMSNWQFIVQFDYEDGSNGTMDSPIGIYNNRLVTYDDLYLKLYNIEDLNNIFLIDQEQCVQTLYPTFFNDSFFKMKDNYLYLSTFKDGIHKYEMSDNDIRFSETYIEYPSFHQMFTDSNYIFGLNYDFGLYLFDVSDVNNPILIPHNISQNLIYNVIIQNDKIGVSGQDGNDFFFNVYDFSDPYDLQLISHTVLAQDEYVRKINADWDEVYISNADYYNQYLRKSYLEEDGSLNEIYTFQTMESTMFQIFDDYAYFLTGLGNTTCLNVLAEIDSDYPELIYTIEIGSYDLIGMAQNEGLLQFTSIYDEITFFYETSNPEEPEFLTQLDQQVRNAGCYYNNHFFSPVSETSYIYDFTDPPDIVYPVNQATSHTNIMQIDNMNINNQDYLAVCNQGSIEIWSLEVTNSADDAINVTESKLTNHPNPFNPSTTISFELNNEQNEQVQIEIYNIKGQLVQELGVRNLELGMNEVVWNAEKFASGVYFYKLNVDGKQKGIKKMLLLK
jgi:hypothetical protein